MIYHIPPDLDDFLRPIAVVAWLIVWVLVVIALVNAILWSSE